MDTGACQLLQVEECRAIGYSAYIAAEVNQQEIDITTTLQKCGSPREPRLTLFLCAEHLPAFGRTEAPTQPCKALCEGMTVNIVTNLQVYHHYRTCIHVHVSMQAWSNFIKIGAISSLILIKPSNYSSLTLINNVIVDGY